VDAKAERIFCGLGAGISPALGGVNGSPARVSQASLSRQEDEGNNAPRFNMRWQTERDYDRILVRYNRRRRSFYRSLYRRAAKAAGIVTVAALLLFSLSRYLGL
jgi:hypothetical protein